MSERDDSKEPTPETNAFFAKPPQSPPRPPVETALEMSDDDERRRRMFLLFQLGTMRRYDRLASLYELTRHRT